MNGHLAPTISAFNLRCESFYAQVASNPTLTLRVCAEQGVVALTALASMRLHAMGTSLERLADKTGPLALKGVSL